MSRKSAKNEKSGTKLSWSKRISSDARIIWSLHKEQPLRFEELTEKAGISSSTLYRTLPLMMNEGFLRELTGASEKRKGVFALSDYRFEEDIIRKFIENFFPIYIVTSERRSRPLIEFIEDALNYAAIQAGKDPKDKSFRQLFYKAVKEFFSSLERFLPPKYIEYIKKKYNKTLEELEEELKSFLSES